MDLMRRRALAGEIGPAVALLVLCLVSLPFIGHLRP
jgi:hypothetical protein